jgi:hypothetical protein
MTRAFDPTFRPLAPGQPEHAPLPKQFEAQLAEAAKKARQDAEKIDREAFERPNRGPVPKDRAVKVQFGMLVFATQVERDTFGNMFDNCIGKRARGNKRIGKTELYADLIMHFSLLKRRGIPLPRNKRLSAKACQHGLGEILRRHGCMQFSDTELARNGEKRQGVAARMDRIFAHVASIV